MARRTFNQTNVVTARQKVEFLRHSENYPESTTSIRVIETHKSWVFLTDRFAYKLKKAIRYDSVDFRQVDTRRANCLEEIRLNRRLAPDVYVDVVPIKLTSSGGLSLGGAGIPVDWLVKMRRLPDELMLDRKIRDGSLTEQEVSKVAAKLADFYRSSLPVELTGDRYREMLRNEIRINHRDLDTVLSETDSEQTSNMIRTQLEFLDRNAAIFEERVRDGRVVEGHGDLRPEHICLEPEPVIFDCLEFDPELRILDAADELGFLAMQCERLGARWIGLILFDSYMSTTGDAPSERLIWFYKSYRSATWARLAAWRARELGGDGRAKWIERCRDYLELAVSYAELSA